MQQNNRNVPDWLLERLALGELDAETAADVRRRLVAEGRSPDDVAAAVAASNREILAQLPATQAAAEIRQRAARAAAAEQPARKRAFFWGMPLALAGGVALVVVLARPTAPVDNHSLVEPSHYDGIKGSNDVSAPRLFVYRHRATANEALSDGARAARGDLVQLAYRSRGGGYGVLLSIDGAGKVTLHWPENKSGSAAALKTSGEVRLPASYELDDAPAFERFFLVRSTEAFSVATAMQAARSLAAQPTARQQALALPPGFEQISLALDKTHAAKKELP
jgi:hypothetical protein